MSETAILTLVFGFAFSVVAALVGVVWAMLTGRIGSLERGVSALTEQNTRQETDLATLRTSSLNMSQRHEESREDMREWMRRLEAKLDRVLSGPGRSGSPSPGRYEVTQGKEPR